MTPKAKERVIATEREQRQLRFSLIKDILRCDTVRTLPSDEKKWLFSRLSGAWRINNKMPPETSRIRALEKVASDARRLRASLHSLDDRDTASLAINYERGIPLATRLLVLQELENNAAELSKAIKGQQKEIARLIQQRTAVSLVETLCAFGISCRTRNDHDVAEHNVTTAMRCVMFSMLDGKIKKASWSRTTSIIKLGLRTLQERGGKLYSFGRGPHMSLSQDAVDSFRLFRLEEPIWNGLGLSESFSIHTLETTNGSHAPNAPSSKR